MEFIRPRVYLHFGRVAQEIHGGGGPMHDVEDAVRQARSLGHVREEEGGPRVFLRGLEDEGVAFQCVGVGVKNGSSDAGHVHA